MNKGRNLIQKYINNDISEEEIFQLSSLLKNNENLKLEFQNQIKDNYIIDLWKLKENKKTKLKRIQENNLFKTRKNKNFTWFKYAVAAMLVGVAAFSVWKLQFQTNTNIITNNTTNNVVLKLGDGTTKIIKENGKALILDAKGNQVVQLKDNQLNYTANSKDSSETIVYNEIIVPNGKRIHIRLSDNTLVYVNSDSRFKYPVNFKNSAERKVHINGEAYFEVSKDVQRPFIVNTNEVAVKVLGTHFNVRAYKEDGEIKTTLAEGKVQVSLNSNIENNVLLKPGEAGTWDENDESLSVTKVNVENDMAWIENRLLFIDEPFLIIKRKIERSYGVIIKNNYPALNTVQFNGDFDIKEESIDEVLRAFSLTEYFNYTFDNGIITIKK